MWDRARRLQILNVLLEIFEINVDRTQFHEKGDLPTFCRSLQRSSSFVSLFAYFGRVVCCHLLSVEIVAV
ncbi:unnamed protein product [Brassica oleracea]